MKTLSIPTILTAILAVALLNGCSVPKSSFATAQGQVVKVYTTTDGDYKFISYVVKRNGDEIIVSDALGQTNHKVGDTLTYIDQKIEVSNKKMMAFTIVK